MPKNPKPVTAAPNSGKAAGAKELLAGGGAPPWDPNKLRDYCSASQPFNEHRLRELCKIGRVSQDRADALYICIQYSLFIVGNGLRNPYKLTKRRPNKPALNRVAKCVGALRAALGELEPTDRARLFAPKELWSPTFEDFQLASKDYERIETAIEELEERAERARSPKLFPPQKGGRSPGAFKDQSFCLFVLQLITSVEHECAGRLSFSYPHNKGRLLDALHVLAPCLPPGFIPNPMPYRTLIRLLNDARRNIDVARQTGGLVLNQRRRRTKKT